MIPKVIHYCWFGKSPLPKDVKKCIKSWKKYCPDYEIIEWNEENFNINCNNFTKEAYRKRAWAFVSDYARLKVVYDNGGIYLDTDVELLKGIDSLLESKCFFATQAEPQKIATGLGFGAEKKHYIIKNMMDMYENLEFSYEKKENFICPQLNTEPLIEKGYVPSNDIQKLDDVVIYPPRYFDPINSSGFNITYDTISIHHYSASWENGFYRIKRKFAAILGPSMEGKIKKIRSKIKPNID